MNGNLLHGLGSLLFGFVNGLGLTESVGRVD